MSLSKRLFEIVGAALLLSALVFLMHIPSIVASNATEVKFERADVESAVKIFLLFFAFVAVVLFLSWRWRRETFAALGALALSLVVWNALAGFVSTAATWQAGVVAVCEVAFLIGSFLVMRRLPAGALPQFLALFGFLNAAFYTYQVWGTYVAIDPPAPPPAARAAADVSPSPAAASRGNVYHIMLDAFSKYALALRSDDEIAKIFDGFTWYKNANSNYGRTALSMRSVFSGAFNDTDIMKWSRASFTGGFGKDIDKAGVAQYYYPFYTDYCYTTAIKCESTVNLYTLIKKDVSRALLLDALFINNLPPSLRTRALGNRTGENFEFGFSITSWWDSLRQDRSGSLRLLPIQSVTIDTFERFLEAEPELPSSGRYTYLHMMVPHGPTFADGQCKIEPREVHDAKTGAQRNEDAYSCALWVVRRTMEVLRQLNRLENSLVIVHSDHGPGAATICAGLDPKFRFDPAVKHVVRELDSDSSSSQQIACHAGALLMVKRPGQTGFTTSEERFELIDIAPTIVDHYGLDFSRFAGVSMLSQTPPAERVQTYFESTDGRPSKLDHVSRYELRDGEWRYIERVPVIQAKPGS